MLQKPALIVLILTFLLSGCFYASDEADYHDGYLDGYNEGYAECERFHEDDYQAGYDSGYSNGYSDRETTPYRDGFDSACAIIFNSMDDDEFFQWWEENTDIINKYDIQS